MTRSYSSVESAIQRNLVKEIRRDYPHLKIIAAQNENSRHMASMGMDVGLPDLMLMERHGDVLRILFLELKTKKGKLQKSQKEWKKGYDLMYAASNTAYGVAYGIQQAREIISSFVLTGQS